MINLHERMLPTSAGVEPATSWSPVGRRIQLSHRGRHLYLLQHTPINLSPAEPGYVLPLQTIDPDQLASEEANWSESALFAIKYVNLYQQSGSNNLIGWKLEMGMAF